MSQVRSIILADNRPADLPLPKNIVRLCRDAGYDLRGIPIIGESCGVTSAWVKYGRSVTMGEALTQDWVGKVVNASPDAAVRIPKVYHAFEHGAFGYIVMEYIDGPECDVSDAPQVGAAVECLIRIKGPITAPGPVGRGPITHRFFVEILAYKAVSQRVSFNDEVLDGLRLCPCDINCTSSKYLEPSCPSPQGSKQGESGKGGRGTGAG